MATITFEGFMGSSPAWTDLGSNTVVLSSSLTDLTAPITVNSYQDGTHAGNDDPGTDQCGTNHMNNIKYLTGSTYSKNGGGSTALTDGNLAANDCTIRLHFNHTSSVAVTNARLFAYNGSTTTTKAVGVTCYAFERGVTATAWTKINDDSGNTGGDNSGQRLDLGDKTAATDNYWYVAVSASPQSVGSKASFDLGFALTYS